MKRIITQVLMAFFLAGSVSLAVPAEAQSHGGGHHGTGGLHGTGGRHASSGHHGTGGHHRILHSSARDLHVHAVEHHHGHRSLVHDHMHSAFWSGRPAGACGRLGWRAHDHHWRSAFDYYGLFDREPGIECVQDDGANHW